MPSGQEVQRLRINGVEYYIVDSIQDFRAEDSFIHRTNKLAQYDGSGESKKHIGTYAGEIGNSRSQFFEYSQWGKPHFDSAKHRKSISSAREAGAVVQDGTCFFSKANLLKYLDDARAEYYKQEQVYHEDIGQFYTERYELVKALEQDHIFFSIYDASDNWDKPQNRGYIRSDDAIWSLWRKLILPRISYLSILKLLPVRPTKDSKPLFYFRILLDYQFRAFVHPQATEIPASEATKGEVKATREYRQGQDAYRRAVIDHMVQCPFSKISDERLLVASHIKPYSVCIKENRLDQALDHLNGLALSPTYDRLFDQGYITFLDDGSLVCGTQLSAYTWERLGINPTAKNKMRIYPENRGVYLDFHRKHVFQDDIEDMVLAS
ncbi:MAG TPA: HNH endonuclease [Flavobacteriales bacterium]|nr:HNH endonuclease [Flavobacteriales bacterium]HMR27816.1 HNH endonuclease [Flavobacteriales bacterium]